MKTVLTLFLLPLFAACTSAAPPTTPVPQTSLAPGEPGPDTIPCDTPVVIKAKYDQAGVQEERAWLDDHYPGHSRYSQGLRTTRKRAYDVLDFTTTDGRHVSVCFDITASFGHY
jgi:hypothetical protein